MSVLRIPGRSAIALVLASLLGVAVFLWPFMLGPHTLLDRYQLPLTFAMMILLVLAVIFGQIADNGVDTKTLALLGVLCAVNAALRPLGAGTAGVETVFFLVVLAGRVFGPGFGFALGATSILASALITSGVGPWLPYQMFGCAWVGLGAGLLPRRLRGRAEVIMLACYGAFSGYLFGFLLNLPFWPASLGGRVGDQLSYLPGASFLQQWHRYFLYDAATSLGWDTGRAVTNFIAILLLGPAALLTFRRAARRAAFDAEPVFSS